MYEFQVDSISDAGLILGRNGDRDIPVGTAFTCVRRVRVLGESNDFRSEDAGVVGPVSLTVHAVHWYQQVIDFVPGGHTAGLDVLGDGLNLLESELARLPRQEYLWLIAAEEERIA